MTAIPPKPDMTQEQAFARLQAWYGTQQKLADLKTAEVLERKGLASFYFPAPEEGTNRLPLGGGFDLKLEHTITRKVDEAALDNVKATQAKKLKLNLDLLFPTKPTLSVTEYRKLTDEQRAFVDTLLDIKESETPGLKIVPQADVEGHAAHKAAAEAANVVLAYTIVETAEDAEEGNYFTDGEGNWWVLEANGEELAWAEVDEETVASLEAQVAMVEDTPAPAKPKRTRRKKGAA